MAERVKHLYHSHWRQRACGGNQLLANLNAVCMCKHKPQRGENRLLGAFGAAVACTFIATLAQLAIASESTAWTSGPIIAAGRISSARFAATVTVGSLAGNTLSANSAINFFGGFLCIDSYYTERCVSDLDGSGAVDIGDVAILLTMFGPLDASSQQADLDRNCFIDTADLSIVLLNFGEDCRAH